MMGDGVVPYVDEQLRSVARHDYEESLMPLKVLTVVLVSSRSELVCMAADKLFQQATDDYATLAKEITCPLSLNAMRVPVACEDGFCYERELIKRHFSQNGHKSPMTNEPISSSLLFPAQHIKKTTEWFVNHALHGQSTDAQLMAFLELESMPEATIKRYDTLVRHATQEEIEEDDRHEPIYR